MTRDTIIMAMLEGYIKDVLTHDLSQHHPRPHQRHRFGNAARKAKEKAREVFRNAPKAAKRAAPKVSRATQPVPVPKGYHHEIRTSSARRPGPTTRERRGRAAVLGVAGVAGAGILAHKLYKHQKQKKKEVREAVRISRQDRRLHGQPVINMATGVALDPEKPGRKLRAEMIEAIMEVFDDTYGAGVFARGVNKKKATDLIRKARKLKQMKVKVKVPQMKISRAYRRAS